MHIEAKILKRITIQNHIKKMNQLLKHRFFIAVSVLFFMVIMSCEHNKSKQKESLESELVDNELVYKTYKFNTSDRVISRSAYMNKLYGFWLGQCIANWTGLVTEMDKIGNIGDIKTGDFYTREDWGKQDQPSIWGEGIPSDLSANIDFVVNPIRH